METMPHASPILIIIYNLLVEVFINIINVNIFILYITYYLP